MAEFRSIDLKGRVPGNDAIEFLSAEVSAEYYLPFAIIRYALEGEEQEDGLRLDLDKQVFLDDHFEEQEKRKIIKNEHKFLKKAAPKIVEFLGAVLYS
jgi:hypothetical protein